MARWLPCALFLGACLAAGRPVAAAPAEVTVAAPSDLVFCLGPLQETFHALHPEFRLVVSTGSSGNLFAQIRRGAPFDVYLSADLDYPRQLIAAGAAEAGSLRVYAIGALVLWTRRPDLNPTAGWAVLDDPSVRRLALANPAHAPYGRAARAALERAGRWELVQSRLVLGDNIAQAAQLVDTGHADAGLVALSLVLAPAVRERGRHWRLPPGSHPPIEQGVVLTRRGADRAGARAFLEFLVSPSAQAVFAEFGFDPPAVADE